jgi:uroporphyrinogen III methyltransferase/synthase
MTRRTFTGRITFVGAGPGDPGLLTRNAASALAVADRVIHDALPEPLLAGAGEVARPEAVWIAASGGPEETAQAAVAAAKAGEAVVRLVAGSPLTSAGVTAEVRAAAKAGLSFELVPGVTAPEAVTAYAGMALGGVRTVVEVRPGEALEFAPLVAAGSLALAVDVIDLARTRDGLLAAGLAPGTPVSITGDGTTEIQSTSLSTLEGVVEAALGLHGQLVLAVGPEVTPRDHLPWWENRPLYGWKVLVPRTKEQAGAMSSRLQVWGAIPQEVPTIAVEPPRTPAQMERAIKGLVTGRYEWVIFTSANAVRAVWEKFAEFGLDARAFAGVKIACVGEVTADAVRSFGIRPELLPSGEQSTEGLLADFPPYDSVLDPINRVLLPRADIATEVLSAGLVERGWEVDDVTAYRTVRAAPPAAEIRDAIKAGGYDAVLFTSSSTVRNLVGIAGKPHARTVVACIGPKTAETATGLGLRVDVQPDEATVPALVEALAEYAVDLREKQATAPAKPRRGAKVQGPSAGRLAR